MWSIDTLGDWLLPIIELGHSDLLSGFYRSKFTFSMYPNGNKICLSFHGFWQQHPQLIVLTKTFVPFEQFDLDIILKVTTAGFNLDLADLKWGTYLFQASYQTVLGVLLFAYVGTTNMHGPRSSWPSIRSPEVKTSPLRILVNRSLAQEISRFKDLLSLYVIHRRHGWLALTHY